MTTTKKNTTPADELAASEKRAAETAEAARKAAADHAELNRSIAVRRREQQHAAIRVEVDKYPAPADLDQAALDARAGIANAARDGGDLMGAWLAWLEAAERAHIVGDLLAGWRKTIGEGDVPRKPGAERGLHGASSGTVPTGAGNGETIPVGATGDGPTEMLFTMARAGVTAKVAAEADAMRARVAEASGQGLPPVAKRDPHARAMQELDERKRRAAQRALDAEAERQGVEAPVDDEVKLTHPDGSTFRMTRDEYDRLAGTARGMAF